MTTKGTLLFLEAPENIGEGLAAATEANRSIISLTPHVSFALEQQNIEFFEPFEFADFEQIEKLGEESFFLSRQFCEALDEGLAEICKRLDLPQQPQPYSLGFYNYKVLIDSVWSRIFEINSILEALKPRKIVFFHAPEEEGRIDRNFLPSGSIWGSVIRLLLKEQGIEGRAIPFSHSGVESWRPKETPLDTVFTKMAHPLWERLATPIHHYIPEPIKLLIKRVASGYMSGKRQKLNSLKRQETAKQVDKTRSKNILVVRRLVPTEWLEKKMSVWHWPENKATPWPAVQLAQSSKRIPEEVFADLWRKVSTATAFRKYFVNEGVDWFQIVETSLQEMIVHQGKKTADEYLKSFEVLDQIRPNVLTCGSIGGPDLIVRARAKAAQERGVPVLTHHHGCVSTHVERMRPGNELNLTSNSFVYGPGVAKHSRDAYRSEGIKYHVTGSVMLDGVRATVNSRAEILKVLGLDPAVPTVLFALGYMMGKMRLISRNSRSAHEVFRIERAILSSIADIEGVQIIVKGYGNVSHPVSPIASFIEDLGQRNVKFVWKPPFSLFLDACDVVVFENPETTLLQTLVKDKPAYAHNDCFDWCDEALTLLKGRVVFEENLETFCQRLRKDVSSGEAFRKQDWSNEFLKQYADPFGDGHAEERIFEEIITIAQKQNEFGKDILVNG